MSDSVVRFEVADAVATITLNRPESLNAMTRPLMQGVIDAFAHVAEDASVRVVVLTGAGRGFCAGADLSQAADPGADQPADDTGDVYNNALRAVANCPVPTVARINGAAAGGGFGLALACDIAIASHSAFFVATFGPRLGIVPDMGATWSIRKNVGRARALGIMLLGDRITSQQAAEWGLVWQSVSDDILDKTVAELTRRLARSSPDAMVRIRECVDAAESNTFSAQLDLEMLHQSVLIPRNMQTAAQAFMAKSEPEFDGARRDPAQPPHATSQHS